MLVTTQEQLEEIYNAAVPPMAKLTVVQELIPPYVRLIEMSPFFVLATAGPEGLDCSARGDPPGFVQIKDNKTIAFPDRPGNNKIESLRNIIRDPRVSLMFLIPGNGTILRVNGLARISVDDALLSAFTVSGTKPKSAIIVDVQVAYMQCARALLRSQIWQSSSYVEPTAVPSMGDILSYLSDGKEGGAKYDNNAAHRMEKSLW